MARKSLVVKQQKLERKRTRIYKAKTQAEENGKEYTPPKGWHATKYYNRCKVTGKTRSYMRKFGVSREVFREYAKKGEIMGIKKSSW